MLSKLKLSPLIIGLLLLAGLLVYLNLPQSVEPGKQQRGGKTPVSVSVAEQQEFVVLVEALGTAVANESVSLTAQETEVVQAVHFDDGELVEKGQLLLTLSNREEIARVNELEVNLQEAKRQLTRIKNLAKENVASEQLLDEQEARVKALKAQLEVANTLLAELEIRAPFAGKLGIRQVSVGALVRPGDVVTTLDDLHLIKVDFNIAENHLASINEGQQVIAESIAYQEQSFTGTVTSIDARLDPVTRSIRARAMIENPDLKLRPGMLLKLDLQKQVLNTLVIPERALVPIEDKQYVFVVEGDKVARKEVSVGLRKPGVAQVLSGLVEGEQVVVEGALKLRDGSNVRILTRAEES